MSFFNDVITGASGALPVLAPIAASLNTQEQNSQNWQNWNIATQASQVQSATGYQRAVADMKAAGINPMLAATQGPEAGANIQAPPQYQSPGMAFLNSAEAVRGGALKVLDSITGVQVGSAQAAKARQDAVLSAAQTAKVSGVDTDLTRAQENLARSTTKTQEADAEIEATKAAVVKSLKDSFGAGTAKMRDAMKQKMKDGLNSPNKVQMNPLNPFGL